MPDPQELAPIHTLIALPSDIAAIYQDVAGQLAPRSRKMYLSDARHFAGWLSDNNLDIMGVDRSDIIRYRQYLADNRAKVTAARMLSVTRRLLGEAVQRGLRSDNPAQEVRGFKGLSRATTPHRALTMREVTQLLAVVDLSTKRGRRDHALLMLLLRTGIRRAEAADLLWSDIAAEQGHRVAKLRHAKGDVAHMVKLPVDVWRVLVAYRDKVDCRDGAAVPVFVRFYKGDTPSPTKLSGEAIERIVKRWAAQAEIAGLSPHGLRASFITLSLEGGAKLEQVQYAVGHADPRTTERYQKRKFNLDNNAVDFVRPPG